MSARSKPRKIAASFGMGSILALLVASSLSFAVPSLLPLKNTATNNASTVITYPEERNESGITVFETVSLLAEIANLNTPAVEARATDFGWDFDWTKPWLGAGSLRLESSPEHHRPIFKIMLWGGFVRATGMTRAALEFTLCHEFGHFLAGDPHQVFPDEAVHWSSAEGQADWWAASDCLPRVYKARGLTDQDSKDRIRQAGQDFAHFAFIQYEKGSIEARLDQRALEIPAATLTTAYPTTQCRLDAIVDGAACAFSKNANGAPTSACQRPNCWFR